jgi:hypothetical protein
VLSNLTVVDRSSPLPQRERERERERLECSCDEKSLTIVVFTKSKKTNARKGIVRQIISMRRRGEGEETQEEFKSLSGRRRQIMTA